MAIGSSKVWRCSAAIVIALLPLAPAVAHPARQEALPARHELASPVGEYVHSQMELVAGIRLREDGTFEYGLTVGSLDERAKGRWTQTGGHVELTSDPRPVAPTIAAGSTDLAAGEPFGFRLLAPDGRDVPGVDFSIDFDAGDPLQDYTNGSAWHLPDDEKRIPRFVTFAMPSYRLHSPRLPLAAREGTIANFTLIPNDFGVADLTGVIAEISGDTLTLYRPEGTMRFQKSSAEPN